MPLRRKPPVLQDHRTLPLGLVLRGPLHGGEPQGAPPHVHLLLKCSNHPRRPPLPRDHNRPQVPRQCSRQRPRVLGRVRWRWKRGGGAGVDVRAGSFNTTGRGGLLVDADRSEPVPGSGPIADIAVFLILADAVDVKRGDQLCETVSQPSIQPDKVVRPMGS